jgi:predicted kinase
MLIALAGLPGTGKTALAGHLAAKLPGVVLDKDRLRACLFPPEEVAYSAEQDDFVMDVAYRVADQLFRSNRERHVLIDGRTFSKGDQVADLFRWAGRIGVPVKVVECVCADAVAEERLGRDTARPGHAGGERQVRRQLHQQRAELLPQGAGLGEGEAAMREPHVRAFDITGRPMRNWVAVEPEGVENDDQLHDWVQRALKFVTKLPAK